MKFLPIVGRELRVASRRWSTYWLRTWVAATVGLVALGIVMANLEAPPQSVAFFLFHSVGGGALLYCLMVGARATSDCISGERREGTLGLLFLTDLKGYDVVLGKLVANSLNGFYGLLAVIPVAAVSLLMGGITGRQIACVAVALLNTMFLSMSAGMLASACCRSAKRAIGLTLMMVLILTLGVPGLGMWVASVNRAPRVDTGFFLSSPIFCYVAPQDFVFWRHDMQEFLRSLGVVQAFSWVFLLLACLIVPRIWQDRPAGVQRLRWRERWKQWGYGSPRERRRFRAGLLDQGAFFWLAARDRLSPAWVWATLGLMLCIWAWGWTRFREDWVSPPVFVATAFLLNSVLKNWFASEATRQISEERQAGSLELLLVTPLRLEDIFHGQWLALRRQFFWPVLMVLICEIWMMGVGLRQTYDTTDRLAWAAWWVIGVITLVLDLGALFWVGIWMGLASKQPKRAYSDTVGRVLALPWVIYALFIFYMFFISLRGQNNITWKGYLGVWLVICLTTAVGYGVWARMNAFNQFREAATWRFQRKLPRWKRWLGQKEAGESTNSSEG